MSRLSPVHMMNRWRFICSFSVVCYRSAPHCKVLSYLTHRINRLERLSAVWNSTDSPKSGLDRLISPFDETGVKTVLSRRLIERLPYG